MKEKKWYNDSNKVINTLLITAILVILLSQSFAVSTNISSTEILRNILNHNSIYLFGAIYFIFLKTRVGKKYFNFINIGLIFIYAILFVTSLLTLVQSFRINSLLGLGINLLFLVYMFHVFLDKTILWQELKLETSPFYEITNNSYLYAIVVLSIIVFTVNLVEAATLAGVIISLLCCLYNLLLARYIYLYREYSLVNDKTDYFTNIDNEKVDLPKLDSVTKKIKRIKLNGYQIIAVVLFCISLYVGIVFGNLFPSCGSVSEIYAVCNSTEFNFQLMLAIWVGGFLVSTLFYGFGHLIAILKEINDKLPKKK